MRTPSYTPRGSNAGQENERSWEGSYAAPTMSSPDDVAVLTVFLQLLQEGDPAAAKLNKLRLEGTLTTEQFTHGAKVLLQHAGRIDPSPPQGTPASYGGGAGNAVGAAPAMSRVAARPAAPQATHGNNTAAAAAASRGAGVGPLFKFSPQLKPLCPCNHGQRRE